MSSADPVTRLTTDAWQLLGITASRHGELRLDHGRLRFTLDDGTVVFRTDVVAVEAIVFPWYYFGGGLKLTVAGVRHRISFVRPNNADDAMDRLAARVGDVGAVHAQVAGKFVDIGSGRARGRAWRQALDQSA